MECSASIQVVEAVARGLEFAGVAVIAFAFIHAVLRSLVHFGQKKEGAYGRLKRYMGKALMLGLEFLVAADIIRTVTIQPTRESILSLGLLILVRIVLGWSIAVEIEGCWPWRVAAWKQKSEGSSQESE
jgi:uncharacterized membrane protein